MACKTNHYWQTNKISEPNLIKPAGQIDRQLIIDEKENIDTIIATLEQKCDYSKRSSPKKCIRIFKTLYLKPFLNRIKQYVVYVHFDIPRSSTGAQEPSFTKSNKILLTTSGRNCSNRRRKRIAQKE
ncbi:hypothetical protein GAMM_40241 [Gammaproteobacteria bacterium]